MSQVTWALSPESKPGVATQLGHQALPHHPIN